MVGGGRRDGSASFFSNMKLQNAEAKENKAGNMHGWKR